MKSVIKNIPEPYGDDQMGGVLVNEIQHEHHHGIQQQGVVKNILLIQTLLLRNERIIENLLNDFGVFYESSLSL